MSRQIREIAFSHLTKNGWEYDPFLNRYYKKSEQKENTNYPN